MLTLFGSPLSANVQRVRLTLSALGLAYQEITIDLLRGEQRGPAYLSINPIGQVPALRDGGQIIVDSHAIAVYLARKYGDGALLPSDPLGEADVLQWLFFDANEMHNGIGYARNHYHFKVPGDGASAQNRAKRALGVLESRLASRQWLVLGRPTLADIGCAPLAEKSRDALIEVSDYPHVKDWLQRFATLPFYISQ
jgi:glutathione S-transferase